MEDIFELFEGFPYLGPFAVLILVNIAPILMPPNWLILVSFYALDNSLNLVALAIIGATGSTIGRFILKQIVSTFQKTAQSKNKSNLDSIGNYLNKKKYGYVIASFVFGATPLPDNMLFVAYGLIKAKSLALYAGFWAGKFLSFFAMLTISPVVLTPFVKIFEDRIAGILLVDGIGIVVIVLFTAIDWNTLLNDKKFRLIKPRIWKW